MNGHTLQEIFGKDITKLYTFVTCVVSICHLEYIVASFNIILSLVESCLIGF